MTGKPDALDVKPLTARRRLPRWKKVAFSLATTVMFFAALEGGLALLGVQTATNLEDPYVGFTGSSPLFVQDEHDPSQLTTAANKLAWFNKQTFSRKKAPNTRRVFCLGGSTTYGRPYDDTTSFPGWLRELLPRLEPDTNWEVINAGGVSYASYRIARLMRELVQYEPDVFIVYTGHNEFLEERTYGDLKQASPVQQTLAAAAARTRIGTLARRLLVAPSDAKTDRRFQLPDDVNTVLEHTVGPTTYSRDDAQREWIIQHFEVNLSHIVSLAGDAGAEIVLVTPAANIKDTSPFKSQNSNGLSNDDHSAWKQLLKKGQQLTRNEELEDALSAYQRAEKIDSRFAELHWRIGQVLHKLKQFDESKTAFITAVDEDVCPLRAVSEIPQIIRRVADRSHVPFVDFEQLVAEKCDSKHGHASPGNEFFLDHVHPTIAVNGQLAAAIAERMNVSESRVTDQLMAEVTQQIESRIDARQHAIALRNLAKVLNWAGKHLEAGSLAMRAVEQLPDDPESLVLSAAYLAETGQRDRAIEHYRRALKHRPDYATAHQMLGAALVDRGDLNEALRHFTELARLRPQDAAAWQMIGAIHGEQRRFDEALPHYQTALKLNPDDSNIHYNLANALAHLDRPDESIHHYTRAVELNPDDADAHNNLGVMLMESGRFEEAALHFREVLRIRPQDHVAAENLEAARSAQ